MSRSHILVLGLIAMLSPALLAAFAPGGDGTASAHPLGNFTINHYDRIEVSDTGIHLYSVLDMAEIPAFRERQQIDANSDGAVDDAEAEAYAAAKTDDLRGGLLLRVNGDNADSTLSRFSDLIAKDHLTPAVIALALLAAMGFGAIHALSPGHGKTVVAPYLVGSRGTARHALLLGLAVTLTHTSTVYAMGLVALYLSEFIVPERLYPWLGLASGGLIVVMGLSLVIARLRTSGLMSQTWRWIVSRTPYRTAAAPPSRWRAAKRARS